MLRRRQISLKSAKQQIIRLFFSYGPDQLLAALRRLNLREGDTIMVHASWRPNNGFRGTPSDFVAVLKRAVGANGLLTMTSLPYHNRSSADYLAQGRPMEVRRTPSRMGLLTEVFRRDPETKRSLSPTHPVLAWGRDAAEFVADHDKTAIPFGPESPFGRLLERDGKILLVDAALASITFTHYLEDRIKNKLRIPLYEPEPMDGLVIDEDGNLICVPTYVICKQANAARNEDAFFESLARTRAMNKARIGNTRLRTTSCRKMLECLDELLGSGGSLFEVGEEN